MLKIIAHNYTVILNGYCQWLNIEGNIFFLEALVVLVTNIITNMLSLLFLH